MDEFLLTHLNADWQSDPVKNKNRASIRNVRGIAPHSNLPLAAGIDSFIDYSEGFCCGLLLVSFAVKKKVKC